MRLSWRKLSDVVEMPICADAGKFSPGDAGADSVNYGSRPRRLESTLHGMEEPVPDHS